MFVTAAILSVIGAAASVLAGGKYMHVDTVQVKTIRQETPVEAELSDI